MDPDVKTMIDLDQELWRCLKTTFDVLNFGEESVVKLGSEDYNKVFLKLRNIYLVLDFLKLEEQINRVKKHPGEFFNLVFLHKSWDIVNLYFALSFFSIFKNAMRVMKENVRFKYVLISAFRKSNYDFLEILKFPYKRAKLYLEAMLRLEKKLEVSKEKELAKNAIELLELTVRTFAVSLGSEEPDIMNQLNENFFSIRDIVNYDENVDTEDSNHFKNLGDDFFVSFDDTASVIRKAREHLKNSKEYEYKDCPPDINEIVTLEMINQYAGSYLIEDFKTDERSPEKEKYLRELRIKHGHAVLLTPEEFQEMKNEKRRRKRIDQIRKEGTASKENARSLSISREGNMLNRNVDSENSPVFSKSLALTDYKSKTKIPSTAKIIDELDFPIRIWKCTRCNWLYYEKMDVCGMCESKSDKSRKPKFSRMKFDKYLLKSYFDEIKKHTKMSTEKQINSLDQIDTLKSQITALKAEKTKLEQEHKQSADSLNAQISDEKAKNALLAKELKEVNKKLSDSNEQSEELQKKQSRDKKFLENDIAGKKELLKSYERKNKELEAECGELKDAKEKIMKELNKNANEISRVLEMLEKSKHENRSLTNSLQMSESNESTLRTKVSSLESQLSAEIRSGCDLKRAVESDRLELEEAKKNRSAVEEKITLLRKELQTKYEEISVATAEKKTAERTFEEKCKASEEELGKLKQKLKEEQDGLAKLKKTLESNRKMVERAMKEKESIKEKLISDLKVARERLSEVEKDGDVQYSTMANYHKKKLTRHKWFNMFLLVLLVFLTLYFCITTVENRRLFCVGVPHSKYIYNRMKHMAS